jgi:hypothetical protein
MSVTALMSELATNPARLAEFRVDPQSFLDAANLQETSAAAVTSRNPARIREAVSLESGVAPELASYSIVIIIEI